ncbi:hypothetical protein [Gluconacetobacter liquefaciens]|uniref:Uncharacterized protein n=1 Tax=Gluconacetobacter liquefaciens TaxID=89584 RepID=A0A7W4JKH8_GLULI|nr:hypothetical protein [Gluconacetobacter liquefaciens]MBB2186458.1 hypothetical protein [Gluconacetobacter liquefaciens]
MLRDPRRIGRAVFHIFIGKGLNDSPAGRPSGKSLISYAVMPMRVCLVERAVPFIVSAFRQQNNGQGSTCGYLPGCCDFLSYPAFPDLSNCVFMGGQLVKRHAAGGVGAFS